MKNKRKISIISGLIILVLLISSIFAVVFNYSMYRYIDSEAKKAIKADIKYYTKSEDEYWYGENDEFIDDLSFATTELYFDGHLSIEEFGNDAYFRKTEILYKYCCRNMDKLDKDEILTLPYDNEKYYIAKIPDNISSDELRIVYINTAPYQRLVTKINFIYGILMLFITMIISYIGFKTGEKLDNSEQKMKEFFQNVSHDLKTPIMTIQGYAEGIEQNVIKDHNKAARVIMSESDKMVTLVNEILDLSKFENGVKKLKLTKTDIGELIYEVLVRIKPQAEKKNIDFKIEIDEGIVTTCDNELMERVFLNILSNALRYVKQEIGVQCKTQHNKIIIRIHDDGKALTKEESRNIFKRFYYGNNGLSGVGLALAKEIVDLHNGKVYVEVNNDTCFVIELLRNM